MAAPAKILGLFTAGLAARTDVQIQVRQAMHGLMNEFPMQTQINVAGNSRAAKRAKAMPRSDRRKQLLSVARKIVAEGGVGALTMTALAEAAGVSKPVVYEHFDNGETAAIALLDDYFEAVVEAVDAATCDAATLGEYLSQAVDAEFEFHSGDRISPWGITNGFSSSERLNNAYRQLRKITLETFEELLVQQGVEQQLAEAAGFVLAAMMNSTVYEYGPRRDNQIAKEALKAMMNGALSAILPLQEARPRTPESTLAIYRHLKKLHES